MTIAEQVNLALAGDFVPFAVNVAATEVSETVRPYLRLAEQLGRRFACLNDGLPERLEVEYQGGLAGSNTTILTLAVLKGIFSAGTEEPVSYVNAPQLASERGLEVREVSTSTRATTSTSSPCGRRATPWPGRCPGPVRRHASCSSTTTSSRCPPPSTC